MCKSRKMVLPLERIAYEISPSSNTNPKPCASSPGMDIHWHSESGWSCGFKPELNPGNPDLTPVQGKPLHSTLLGLDSIHKAECSSK